MTLNFKKITRSVFSVLVGGFFIFSVGYASESVDEKSSPTEGVQISPIRFDWRMKSGESKMNEITIHNFSNITHEMSMSVENFYVSEDSQQANFYIPNNDHPLKAYDVINWIELPEDFVLGPGESKRIKFTVSVPINQPTNGYYGSIFFQTKTDDANARNVSGGDVKLKINYRVGSLITLAVEGDEDVKREGSLEAFFASKRVFWNSPIALNTQFKSNGNIHYKVLGDIEVQKFGKTFASIEMKDEIMYPGKIRKISNDIAFSRWDYGVYRAKLNMQSEDGGIRVMGETGLFVVIPWQTTVIILMIILVCIIVVKVVGSKFTIVKKE